MDIVTRMKQALEQIEQSLTGHVDVKALARLCQTSSFNFQRMFSFMTDTTLAEYIRRRRITQAAQALQNTDERILDIALRYGYDSSSSFARAFQAIHGITPSEARREGVLLKAYPRITFQISVKGEKEMQYRIETKEAFQIFGIEGIFANSEEEQKGHTPKKLWDDSMKSGAYDALASAAGSLPPFLSQNLCMVHGFCSYRETATDTFPYMLGAFRSSGSQVDGYTIAEIPACTWAIFPSEPYDWAEFDALIEGMYKRFYTEWLPSSEYEQVDGIDFEVYGGTAEKGYIELWFAVRRRS